MRLLKLLLCKLDIHKSSTIYMVNADFSVSKCPVCGMYHIISRRYEVEFWTKDIQNTTPLCVRQFIKKNNI